MAKITISSSRVYYNELDIYDAFSICSDICTYQSMLHKSYRELFHNNMIDPKYLKGSYHTNDYFPLSAISEAKGLLSSQTTWHEKSIKESEFSYRLIAEKIYSRVYKDGIGVSEVNPAYTSLIVKLKYSNQKGISIHKAASFVITRKGMGYKERLPKRLYDNINEKCYARWRNYNKLLLN